MLLVGHTLWVAIRGGRAGAPGRLFRLDARTGRVRGRFHLPFDPLRLVSGFGSLWLTGQGGDRRYGGVLRVDPRSGRVVSVVRRRAGLGTALAASRNAIWVGGPDRYPKGHEEKSGVYGVYKIDPRQNAVVRHFRLRSSTVIDLVGDGKSLWIAGWYAVAKLSESGRRLLRQPIRGSAWSIARAGDGVWAAHTFYGRRGPGIPPPAHELFRIRERSQPRVTAIDVDESPWEVSAGGGVVWVARAENSHEVERFRDDRPPMSLTRVAVAGIVRGLEVRADVVWVSQISPNQLSQIC